MVNVEKYTDDLRGTDKGIEYPDMIPVPKEELVNLLNKQVELDLIYASADTDKYGTDTIVKKLFRLRFGREAGGDDNA